MGWLVFVGIGGALLVAWVWAASSLVGEAERKLGRPLSFLEVALGAQNPLLALLLLSQIEDKEEDK